MALKRLAPKGYIDGILAGDRIILSKAITLVESRLESDWEIAQAVLDGVLPATGNSFRIGLTGAPGVGKSTFIESFGIYLATEKKTKLAVLAVDPSSQVTKGSILGDKTRMETLSNQPNVFIRPSPAGHTLGGVANKTRESILLCEAAGYEVVFVETVGVGQSETMVNGMVDFFLLLMLAGAGDELQGIKKGIIELSDMIIITKADGDNIQQAKAAQMEYQNAINLLMHRESGLVPKVLTCSATKKLGLDLILQEIENYRSFTYQNGFFNKKREEQKLNWMNETIKDQLMNRFYNNQTIKDKLKEMEQLIMKQKLTPTKAASDLLKFYYNL